MQFKSSAILLAYLVLMIAVSIAGTLGGGIVLRLVTEMSLLDAVSAAFKLNLVSMLVYGLGTTALYLVPALRSSSGQGIKGLLQVYRACAVIAAVALALIACFGLGINAGVAVVTSIGMVSIQWLTCAAMFKPIR